MPGIRLSEIAMYCGQYQKKSPKNERLAPLKMVHPPFFERKIIWTKQSFIFLGSMLIFQGVYILVQTYFFWYPC